MPRLCIIGPLIGRNAGQVITQGERLADLFEEAGYSVIASSAHPNRYLRLVEIVWTLLRRRQDYDIVVLQVFSGPSFVVADVASWIARAFGKPLVMVLRGGALPAFAAEHPGWVRRVFDRADRLIAPSAYLGRWAASFQYAAEVIPNVIELTAYPYRHRDVLRPRLFWMRSFHEIYNPALAVRVLVRVMARWPDTTLVMAGPDQGQEGLVRKLTADLGVASAVEFAGFLDRAGKTRRFGDADIYLNTNRIDNLPVSVLEACASGLPVVATAVGGVPDLLKHDETALLVPDDDETAMTDAVLRLLDEPGVAGRLSERGRDVAKGFSIEAVMPKWHRLVGQLAAAS